MLEAAQLFSGTELPISQHLLTDWMKIYTGPDASMGPQEQSPRESRTSNKRLMVEGQRVLASVIPWYHLPNAEKQLVSSHHRTLNSNISPGVDGPAIRSLKSYLRLPQLPLTVGGVIELQQGRALAPDVLRQRHVPHQHLIPATWECPASPRATTLSPISLKRKRVSATPSCLL